jgi:transposase InsO family protein
VKSKDELHNKLMDYYNSHVVKTNSRMSVLQSDYDSVARSKKVSQWLSEHSIQLSMSAPYKHSQNGQIERDVQSVMDKARTLMIAQDVPPMFWEYAIQFVHQPQGLTLFHPMNVCLVSSQR